MRVLRAAVLLGVSTPLVVLACGSDDNRGAERSAAGEGGEGSPVAGNSGAGGSAGASGSPAGGEMSGGASPSEGGVSGSGAEGGASSGAAGVGGEGGVVNQPACADGVVADAMPCFKAPLSLSLVEGTAADLAIADFVTGAGPELVVTSSGGALYFASDGAGGLQEATSFGASGVLLGVGQLDSESSLDLVVGQSSSGSAVVFGDGAGQVTTTESASFGAEGTLYNYFVANVEGSSPSQDLVVTYSNAISLVLTSGTEGENFVGYSSTIYPTGLKDAVLAQLGDAQWLVYSAETSLYRQLVTYDAGSYSLGEPIETPVAAAPAQLDVGDFNGDGNQDVVATTDSGSLRVLFGDGTDPGDFQLADGEDRFVTLTVGASEEAATQQDVKVGDFDGDGDDDVAVTVAGLNTVAVFFNDGDGVFSERELLSTGDGSAPTRLAAGDLNGDGVDDLAVVSASGQVIVLLSDP